MDDYVELDGSLLEGGGQMIRSSLALSQIFNKGFRMHSIRKNRPNPGINNQLRSVFSAFSDKVPKVGDQEIYIYPHFGEPTIIKSTTAASCTLMLQCFVPVFAALGYRRDVKIEGGTDVSRSPCLESIEEGLRPLMIRMGVDLNIKEVKKGYYPKGNGFIIFNVKTTPPIKPINLVDFSPPNRVLIKYYVKGGKLPAAANNFKNEVRNILETAFPEQKVKVELKMEKVFLTKDDYGIGCLCLGDGVVWDVGTVGEKVTEEIILVRLRALVEKKVCLDEHHQDQLILLATLAEGTSRLLVGHELSLHTQSMMYVIKQFLPEFSYSHAEGILTIEGMGCKAVERME